RGSHLVAVAHEDGPDGVAQRRVVLDDEDPAQAGCGASGIVNLNTAPGSARSSTATVPACASTRPLTIARPRPVPPLDPLVWPRKKRSNIRLRISAGVPGP